MSRCDGEIDNPRRWRLRTHPEAVERGHTNLRIRNAPEETSSSLTLFGSSVDEDSKRGMIKAVTV